MHDRGEKEKHFAENDEEKMKENKYPKTDHIKKINKICAKFV